MSEVTGSRWALAVCAAYTGPAAARILEGGVEAVDAVADLVVTVEADRWPGYPAGVLWWCVAADGSDPGVTLYARAGEWR
jgi:hypothetical protein